MKILTRKDLVDRRRKTLLSAFAQRENAVAPEQCSWGIGEIKRHIFPGTVHETVIRRDIAYLLEQGHIVELAGSSPKRWLLSTCPSLIEEDAINTRLNRVREEAITALARAGITATVDEDAPAGHLRVISPDNKE